MSEEKLIADCKQNDRQAQLQLYKQYSGAMYTIALRFLKNTFDAEEAMQDGFIAAYSKLHQFNGESTFGAWLKKIVIRKSLDKLKTRKMELTALNEHFLEAVDTEDNWEIEENISVEQVKTEIENLPDKYRYPLMLFLIEGYDHEEISEILNISSVSSRTLLHRGKKKLQKTLKAKYHGTGLKGYV
ncbi:MAG TPA: RNA polymerase sigma factor [Flavobacteriaceae bacterium]|nr:RNA polymerase sigma factor [Flavobacteriaceae bacterium]